MSETSQSPAGSALALAAAAAAVATTVILLDVTWLGVVARSFYDSLLGPLRRPEVFWPAAALFYIVYTIAVLKYAVIDSSGPSSALRRGAALGFVAYAVYELTNCAVVRDWPALLVPVDIAWGITLTAVAGFAGKLAHAHVLGRGRK